MWPLASIITPTPPATVAPLIPAIKVFVWFPIPPMRIVFDSAATPKLPMSILLLPVVGLKPAL
jgi:hypothetical protein